MPFPDICVDDRETCANEIPTLCFQQQTEGSQTVQLRDKNGNPIELAANNVVCFNTKALWNDRDTEITNKEVIIDDYDEGMVTLNLTVEDLKKAGIWLGEFTVYRIDTGSSSSSGYVAPYVETSNSSSSLNPEYIAESVPIFRFKVYMQSEENLTNTDTSTTGLTIAEVRLAIRDRCAEDNFLLDSVEFSNTEIAWAIRRPVTYWNETPPPIPPVYTPATFPFRYHWVGGVIGELLSIASLNYERNRLRYAAANLSVDDKDKSAYYLQQAQAYKQEYRTWVLRAKKAINIRRCYGTTSIYSFGNRFVTYEAGLY